MCGFLRPLWMLPQKQLYELLEVGTLVIFSVAKYPAWVLTLSRRLTDVYGINEKIKWKKSIFPLI